MRLILAALLAQADPPMEALAFLMRHRDPDGLWERAPSLCRCAPATVTGNTSRVVLAFLSLGYSPLAKDEIADVQLGPLLEEALSFLQKRQREDGALYLDDPTANAWAARALAEAYSLTGSKLWRDSAKRAAEFVLGMPATDDSSCLVQTAARVTLSMDGIMPKGPEPRFPEPLRRAVVARWWGRKEVAAPRVDPRTASAEEVEWGDMLLRNDSHRRSEHRAWAEAVAEGQRQTGCEAGSWKGSIRNTAAVAGALFAGRCWPCRNVFNND